MIAASDSQRTNAVKATERKPALERQMTTEGGLTLTSMAVAVKKLDVKVGDLIEVGGRRYDIVSDKAGGITLEPAITDFEADLDRRDGTRPATQEEFEQLLGDLPSDGEG